MRNKVDAQFVQRVHCCCARDHDDDDDDDDDDDENENGIQFHSNTASTMETGVVGVPYPASAMS